MEFLPDSGLDAGKGRDHGKVTAPEPRPAFKAKVALAAIRGEQTLVALSQMEAAFCIEAVEEVLVLPQARHLQHRPGMAVHLHRFTAVLKKAGVAISMDGKGAWRDNVFVERLRRSIKYEEVYLHA